MLPDSGGGHRKNGGEGEKVVRVRGAGAAVCHKDLAHELGLQSSAMSTLDGDHRPLELVVLTLHVLCV